MIRVSLVGHPSSGRTVFLTLLYETMVRRAANELTGDQCAFRLTADPQYTHLLGGLRTDLAMGCWPTETTSTTNLCFRFGKKRKFSRKHHILDLKILDMVGCRSSMRQENCPGASQDREWKNSITGSDVAIFFVDTTRMISANVIQGEDIRKKYDLILADCLMELMDIAAPNSSSRLSPRRLHILPVFSKFDIIDAKFLAKARLAGLPPSPVDRRCKLDRNSGACRREYASRMMSSYLPATGRAIREAEDNIGHVSVIAYFFCGLSTESGINGKGAPKISLRNSTFSFTYTVEEYLGLIEQLWDIGCTVPSALTTV